MKSIIVFSTVLSAILIFSQTGFSSGNKERSDKTVDLINSASVIYETESESPNITVSLLKLYLQLSGPSLSNIYLDIDTVNNEISKIDSQIEALDDKYDFKDKSEDEIKTLENEKKQEEDVLQAKRNVKKKERDELHTFVENEKKKQILIPTNIFYNQSVSSETYSSEKKAKILNYDILNPTGGLFAGEIYYKYTGLTKNSSDVRYWTIKPSITGSFIRLKDEGLDIEKNIFSGKLNLNVLFIAPGLSEDKTSDAGALRLHARISGGFFESGKTKEMFALRNKDEEKDDFFLLLNAGIQFNIFEIISLSFEGSWPFMNHYLDKSISASATFKKF